MGASPSEIAQEEPQLEQEPVEESARAEIARPRYTIELGTNKPQMGHPKEPWTKTIVQNQEGLVRVDLDQWYTHNLRVPRINFQNSVFPFPFASSQVQAILMHDNVYQGHKIELYRTIYTPCFIYTPEIYMWLNAAMPGDKVRDNHWLSPIQLSSTVLLFYHQVVHMLMLGDQLVRSQKDDCLDRYREQRQDVIEKCIVLMKNDPALREMWETNLHNEEGMRILTNYLCSLTINQIRLLESLICRLSGEEECEPNQKHMKPFWVEGALPDPQEDHIAPHAQKLQEMWRRSNIDYVKGRAALLKRGCDFEDTWNDTEATLRGVSLPVAWETFQSIMEYDE